MKKRFTIMLNNSTIKLIKALYDYYTPSAVRSDLESILNNYAVDVLSYHNSEKLTEGLKNEK